MRFSWKKGTNTTKRLETRSCASACTHGLRHAHNLIVGQFSVLLLLVGIRSGSVHFSTMTHGIVMKDRDTRGGFFLGDEGSRANGSESRHARTRPADVLSRYTLPRSLLFSSRAPFFRPSLSSRFCTRPWNHPSPISRSRENGSYPKFQQLFANYSNSFYLVLLFGNMKLINL